MPAAGPYYVASYTPGQGAVLKRNPNYHGSRPHALDEIDYSVGIGTAQSVKEIEAGTADFAVVNGLAQTQRESLNARYGPDSPAARAGDQRYFVHPDAQHRIPVHEHQPTAVRERRTCARRSTTRSTAGRSHEPRGLRVPRPSRPTSFSRRAAPVSATRTSTRSPRIWRRRGGLPAGSAGGQCCMSAPIRAARSAQLIQAELKPIGINVEIVEIPGSGPTIEPAFAAHPSTSLLPSGSPSTRTPPTRSTTSSTAARSGPRGTATTPTSTIRPTTASSPPHALSPASSVMRPTDARSRSLAQRSTRRTALAPGRAGVLLRARRLRQVYEPSTRSTSPRSASGITAERLRCESGGSQVAQPTRSRVVSADSSPDDSRKSASRGPSNMTVLGDRFWGQVQGLPGPLKALRGVGAAGRRTSRVAGKAR